MLSRENLDKLADAIDALNAGDGMPFAALAPLTDLSAAGHDISIDFSAQDRLGTPVIVAKAQPGKSILEPLSPKRRAVAELVIKGMSNKAIAAELGLALGTIKDHVHVVLRTCGCSSRTELMARVHGHQTNHKSISGNSIKGWNR